MGVEEFGFGLSTVGSFAIPPGSSIAIDDMTTGSFHRDVGTGEGDERTVPFLIFKGGSSFESNLQYHGVLERKIRLSNGMATYRCTISKIGQIKSLSGRNSNAIENDVRATLLTGTG